MKPLFMRLKAFGPFSDRVDVSFERVFDGGLFLIHGRTGAGKTSLLDGLCFSLFGRPSSEEREKDLRGLRSDLASADTMTETELIFAIGSTVYRVHRIPTQPTPKKRGEGFTEHKGSAEVYRLEASLEAVRDVLRTQPIEPDFSKLSWLPLAGKVEAVDAAIEKLLGMNERQFRQVVVLPQGKFREFLSSTSTERQAILEKLFQTDRFSRLQQFIATRARNSENTWREASQGLQSRLSAIGLSSLEDIQTRKEELAKKSDETHEKLTTARTSTDLLAKELNQIIELERTRERFSSLQQESNMLAEQNDEIDVQKRRAFSARLWLPIFAAQDQMTWLEKKSSDVQSKRSEAARAVAQLGESSRSTNLNLQSLHAKTPSLEEMTAERIRLRELVPILQDVERSTKQIALDEAKNSKAQETMSALGSQISELEKTQSSLVHSLFSSNETESAEEAKHLAIEDRRIKELELGFHQSEASRLAAVLKPGEPCPVCGSQTHPKPAQAKANIGTAELIAREKKSFEKTQSDFSERRTRRQTRLEPLLTLIQNSTATKKHVPIADFTKSFEQFDQASKTLITQRQNLDALEVEFRTRTEALESARSSVEQKRISLPEAERSLEAVMKRGLFLKTEQETREPEIRRLEKLQIQINSDLAGLNGTILALEDELKRLDVEIVDQKSNLSNLEQETKRQIAETNGTSTTSVARMTESEIKAIETRVEKHLELTTRTNASLAELAKSLEHVKTLRPLAQVTNEFELSSKSRTEFEQAAARLHVDLENLLKLEAEAARSTEKLVSLKNAAERSNRMSALLTGDRSQNKILVPLSRFVLQSRFEEVLEQANRRLTRMSRGQFQLRRPALSRNLRDSQGLELSVEDSIAGKERHAGSLSGGESFMAALSLALGLADVVQADLGGVRLDSVLIDEGFGTLDSESLDLAMRTLVDLQAGGRMVGIISHVQELKTQVQEQLEVVKSANGSHVLWKN